MAWLKYANARMVKAGVNGAEWDHVRRAALAPAVDFRNRTAKVLLEEYDPKRFLLSHCTIIASVDTEEASNPLGKHMVDGFQIDRRYPDYLVTAETSKYVNNNNDCWERKLLLSCFKTFIGAENYVEHIQIPELSKGKIIDAAARNIGDSVYVDILIATDRSNDPLVQAITSGQLGTLSMGCSVEFTTCTKCGNVAEDETHLCPHIRYFKGSEFVDEFGKKRKIAELCGHVKDEPGSVKFIEASWVANPAFTGAVLRNILSPEEVEGLSRKIQIAFSEPARIPAGMQRAARVQSHDFNILKMAQGEGGEQGKGQQDFPGDGAAPAKPKEGDDPLHKAVADLADQIRERAVEQVRKEIGKSDTRQIGDENLNESLIKSAMRFQHWRSIGRVVMASVGGDLKMGRTIIRGLITLKSGGWVSLKTAGFKGHEILAVSRVLDLLTRRSSMAGESRVYRTVMAVGGTHPYQDVETYLTACRQVLGRPLTGSEAGALVQKGRLFSLGS